MPRVFSKRRPKEIPHGAVYVGRPTQYGNPFSKGSKQQNIEDFKCYAVERLEREPNWLDPLKGKDVVCWCAPQGCHGDVLVELANQTDEDDSKDWDDRDWDAWAEANAPEPSMIDFPSEWEIRNGLA